MSIDHIALVIQETRAKASNRGLKQRPSLLKYGGVRDRGCIRSTNVSGTLHRIVLGFKAEESDQSDNPVNDSRPKLPPFLSFFLNLLILFPKYPSLSS